jgi:hypothetical protein
MVWPHDGYAEDDARGGHDCASPLRARRGRPARDDAVLEIALRLKALADSVRVKLVSLSFSSDAGEECSCDGPDWSNRSAGG